MQKVSLYEKVAGDMALLIKEGTFRPGDRIPSVRELSHQRQVSITTVMEAYRLLEDQGIIEGRPQSGYYVRAAFSDPLSEPGISKPSQRPAKVSINELVMMVMKDASNPDLVQLGAAVPNTDLLPLDKINHTMAAVTRKYPVQNIAYGCNPGLQKLRALVARRAIASGCSLTPEDIIVTAGCLEAIMLALRVVCKPGDTVAIESPTYYIFLQAIEILGLKALEIPSHPREGVSLDALRYAIENHSVRACLFVTNFSNPLGSCMQDEMKRNLVELLAEYEIPLIEDDIYGDLSFSHERPKVAKAFDEKGLVILCSSFSKTIAPGYRVGYIVSGRFKGEIECLKYVSTFATASPPQLAIADFLENGGYDHHLRAIRRIYAKNCALMGETIKNSFPEGTKVTRPTGGHILWVELPNYVDSLELYEKAMAEGISIAPGAIFSAQKKYRNFIRLNAATWSEKVEKALSTLNLLVNKMKPKEQ